MKKIVILFSGNGTNLENIAKKLHDKVEIVAAITNNPQAYGIQRAKKLGIPVVIIDHKKYESRETFDEVLVKEIKKYKPDLVVMAGFMRILSPVFTQNIKNVINIHPSLLPLFKGAKAIERSYASDMKVAGVTVHWVSEELDGGKIIDQACFHRDNESLEEFEAKIHELEYELYPKVIADLLDIFLQKESLSQGV
ncbi:phosphoribosylglycinamide formyltransferase-1 [Nitratiruptor tergarcus DSM 16512]|uniref:Phosphoribosylglycinamide formyltransferase n=2 Tax=Nitratiruptor tergarcus TaxID=269259 RepID=A0A1W1WRB9_9BACT|nr:phosphoribosylglycinamide formyltransferase [Nitratiruptor tergarcus]SMC08858.1 phosphoribosylglycinamide formyltransferase-1 [Nitratiruptor tergarcus DSM 16512]